ncbi:MAG: phage integrase SAM-like domain-containing protein, partial [Bacteroidales bacterium]|nr:phage integrase SAM-like domain-containing protein [Bacteroidales bacterium]
MGAGFNVSVIARTEKAKTNGEIPLYLRITLENRRSEISMGISASQWDTNARRAKGKGASKINEVIEEEKSFIRRIKRMFDEEGQNYSLESIKEKYLGTAQQGQSGILERYQTHIAFMTAREGKEYAFKTIQGYKTSYKHFRSFILQLYAVEDILISKLDQSTILEYKKYLLMEKKFGINTVNRYLKHLKNITSQCLNEGTLKKNPFNKITLGFKESDRMPLTELELERLMQHPFRNTTYQKVRDIFVLS